MASEHPSDPAALLTPERCERLRDVFDRALEEPGRLREAWIAAHVPDAEDRAALALLLDAEAGDGPLDMPSEERMRRLDTGAGPSPEGLIGSRIGAFRLMRLLGQGGMSTVFLGEREGAEFRQRAAVKLLRRGLYSALEQRLFRREQQALASLSHPNIAHFIDGGVSEAGVPYLVIEYIDGMPLTQYAAEHRLSLPRRLRLFVVVCRAVAAAHRQLIVHRDLKPSNILVDRDGEVKLLDFGIAKLLDDDEAGATRTAFSALTPDYAAPEQFAGGTITTATDVYALGVVLHELLLGARPSSPDGDSRMPSNRITARTIEPAAALPAGTLRAAVRGDLDNILLKALAAEPERRYASAADLGDDIERHLAAQPVSAHPPSRWYRTRKFVRRHRGSVALTFAFALGVLISLALALWQAGVARREAANARAEALRANTTRDFVERLFEPVRDQLAEGRMPSVRDLVGQGARALDGHTGLEPAQRIDLLMMFSRLQSMLADPDASLALAKRAHAEAGHTLPADSVLRMQAALYLGRAHLRSGDLRAAGRLLREVEGWQDRHRANAEDAIELHANLARLENESGRPGRALAYAEKELSVRIAEYGEESSAAASGYNNLGYALEALGRLDEAIAAYEKSVALDERLLDPHSLQRAFPIGNLAQTLFNAGRLAQARERFAQALALYDEAALEKPPRALLGNLAMIVETDLAAGDLDAARQTLARYRDLAELTPTTYTDRAIAVRLGARIALEAGDIDTARALLASIDPLLPPLAPVAQQRIGAWRDLVQAEIALMEGRHDDALVLSAAGLKGFGNAMYPPYALLYAKAIYALACASAAASDCSERSYATALETMREPVYRDHPALLRSQTRLAQVELMREKTETATERLRTSISAAIERGVRTDSPSLLQAQLWLAVASSGTPDCKETRKALASAISRASGMAHHPAIKEGLDAMENVNCAISER